MTEVDGTPTKVTVVVIDDHQLVVDALERVLTTHPRVMMVGRAPDIAQGIRVVAALVPDVVVMDFRLPDGTGLEATRVIKTILPAVEVVLLTGYATGALLATALEAGCAGFVSKGGRFNELISVIEAVAAGQVRVPPELLDGLVSHLRPRAESIGDDLTIREREVLGLLAGGRSTTDIVHELSLSVHTVRNHIRNLLTKLHASSRLEAVAIAMRAGIIGREH
jgi:DNA-binding NarL/FixJ family response regulator